MSHSERKRGIWPAVQARSFAGAQDDQPPGEESLFALEIPNLEIPRNPMPDFIQVVTTTEQRADADQIAQALVESQLAACVQIVGPITSIYRWKGKVETAQEWQCWAKTRAELYAEVEQKIRQLHPYEVPEILALPVLAGSASYLQWLEAETKSGKA